jgi:hypothetical protein
VVRRMDEITRVFDIGAFNAEAFDEHGAGGLEQVRSGSRNLPTTTRDSRKRSLI